MGDKKRGAREAGGLASHKVARSLLREYSSEGREPAEIRIQRITEATFACEVTVHGEQEPESFFLSTKEE